MVFVTLLKLQMCFYLCDIRAISAYAGARFHFDLAEAASVGCKGYSDTSDILDMSVSQ